MATLNAQVQCRLRPHARWLLYVGTAMARIGLPLPRGVVAAVVNRSWQMRVGDSAWRSVRIGPGGRIIR
jgi:hypothetical protein